MDDLLRPRVKVVVDAYLGDVTFYLADDGQVITGSDYSLPPTDGRWMQVVVVGWNLAHSDTFVRPLLRSFSEGTVWFDDLTIREIMTSAPLAPQPPIVRIGPVGVFTAVLRGS